jgi:HSP20 family protein
MSSDSERSHGAHSLIDGLERLADALRSVTDEARDFEQSVSFGGPSDGVEGVVRVELRTGIGEAERASAATDPTARAAATEPSDDRPVRRPSVEVEEEDTHLTVVAEMPGVTAEALEWGIDEQALSLRATTPRARYERVVSLPAPVEADAATATVEAGIVTLMLPRPADA